MLFSIVVPVFNVEPFLKRCLDSIVSQDFKNFEIILVDDGSTDKSYDICVDYAELHKNISVVRQKNGGPTSARKRAIKKAHGEYIICIDSDDYINQGFLSEANNIILKYKPDIIAFGYNTITGDKLTSKVYDDLFYEGDSYYNIASKFIYDKNRKNINTGFLLNALWGKVVKRTIIYDAIRVIPDSITNGEDLLITALVLDKSKSLFMSSFVSYNYIIYSKSVSHSFPEKYFDQEVFILEKLSEIYGDDNEKLNANAFLFLLFAARYVSIEIRKRDFKSYFISAGKKYSIVFDKACSLRVPGLSLKYRVPLVLLKKKYYGILYTIFKVGSKFRNG